MTVTGHEARRPTAGSAILRAYDSDGITLDDASIGAGRTGCSSRPPPTRRSPTRACPASTSTASTPAAPPTWTSAPRLRPQRRRWATSSSPPRATAITHDVDIHDNTITDNGRGLNVYTGTRRVTFARNRVSGPGYAVYASPAHDLLIDENDIDFTSADATDGAIRIGSSYANPEAVKSSGRAGQIRNRRAEDYTSSNIRILSNRFTGTGTFIQAGSPDRHPRRPLRRRRGLRQRLPQGLDRDPRRPGRRAGRHRRPAGQRGSPRSTPATPGPVAPTTSGRPAAPGSRRDRRRTRPTR